VATRIEAVNLNRDFLVDGLLQRLQFAVLPAHCLLCATRSDSLRDLCSPCAADLVRNRLACRRCALPLQTPAALCGECLQRAPPFDAAFAPYVYAHPLDLLMMRLKFGRSLAAGRVLSELWTAATAELAPPRPDLLVPVPLHPSRLRERGYNQALELAKPLATAFAIPLAANLLSRERATIAQTGLDAVARRRNLRGAFRVSSDAALPAHVVVLDDVMTTGATLRECAVTLRRAGVSRVDVWALARAPHR
jgi:ComF family protein